MRSGTSPTSACRRAVGQIATKYPAYTGAVIAASRQGDHGRRGAGVGAPGGLGGGGGCEGAWGSLLQSNLLVLRANGLMA